MISTLNLNLRPNELVQPSEEKNDEDGIEEDVGENDVRLPKTNFSPKDAVFSTPLSIRNNVKTLGKFVEPTIPQLDKSAQKIIKREKAYKVV